MTCAPWCTQKDTGHHGDFDDMCQSEPIAVLLTDAEDRVQFTEVCVYRHHLTGHTEVMAWSDNAPMLAGAVTPAAARELANALLAAADLADGGQ